MLKMLHQEAVIWQMYFAKLGVYLSVSDSDLAI